MIKTQCVHGVFCAHYIFVSSRCFYERRTQILHFVAVQSYFRNKLLISTLLDYFSVFLIIFFDNKIPLSHFNILLIVSWLICFLLTSRDLHYDFLWCFWTVEVKSADLPMCYIFFCHMKQMCYTCIIHCLFTILDKLRKSTLLSKFQTDVSIASVKTGRDLF